MTPASARSTKAALCFGAGHLTQSFAVVSGYVSNPKEKAKLFDEIQHLGKYTSNMFYIMYIFYIMFG